MYLSSLALLLAVLIYLVVTLVKRIGRLAILLLYPGIMFSQYIVNLITLDSGVFVNELGTMTKNAYSAQVYVFFLIVFVSFLILFCPKNFNVSTGSFTWCRKKLVLKRFKPLFIFVFIASFCCIAYVFLDMLISGIPLLSGGVITHYNYFKDYSRLPRADTASNFLTFFAALLGSYYALSNKFRLKSASLTVTALMLLCRVLLGFKMTGLIDVAIAFLVGAMLFGADASRLKTKSAFRVVLLLGVLAAVFIGLYLNYMVFSGEATTMNQALDLLYERVFGMGAHLWWAALADQTNGFSIFPRSDVELLSPFMLMSEFDTSLGAYGMMLQYGNPVVVTADVAGGVRYTADFIATAIYYNGYILGTFVIIAVAGLVAVLLRLFDKFVYEGRVGSFLVAYYLFTSFTTYFCATGTLTTFFNIRNYIVLILLGYICMVDAWGRMRAPGSHDSVYDVSEFRQGGGGSAVL